MPQGARDFVLSSYQELKKANPKLPILVRESEKAEAKLTARYDFGAETAVSVEGLDKAGITKQLEELVKRGESMPRCASLSSEDVGHARSQPNTSKACIHLSCHDLKC